MPFLKSLTLPHNTEQYMIPNMYTYKRNGSLSISTIDKTTATFQLMPYENTLNGILYTFINVSNGTTNNPFSKNYQIIIVIENGEIQTATINDYYNNSSSSVEFQNKVVIGTLGTNSNICVGIGIKAPSGGIQYKQNSIFLGTGVTKEIIIPFQDTPNFNSN